LGEVAVFSGILLMGIGGGVGSTAGAHQTISFRHLASKISLFDSLPFRFSDRQVNPNPVYRLGELKEEDSAASTEAHNYTLLYLVFFSSGR
jgi:Trk-type K+ transport system membrane component